MANNTRKISELSSKGIVPESALLPVAVAGTEKETYRTTLNNLRSNLLFENAYETLAEGIAATVKDEIFYVYTDESQFYVAAFTNVNGASATALYKDNTPVIYGTGKMMADGKFGSYTSYVSYLYNNGSANGGETEIALPFDCFDVSEMFLNGSHQFKGLNYTFDRLSNKVKLKGALTAGAFVVFYVRPYPGTPITPVEPGITDYVNVTWLYNDGAAVGGETSLTPPWTFSTVPAIYINGSKQVLNKHYEVDSTGLKINLSKALNVNDVVEVLLGGSRSIITAQVSGTPAEVLLTLGQTTGATKVNTSYGVSLEQVVQGFYGVNSFDDLRNRRPNFEGEKVNLKGYYTGSTSGGGQFIGHLGTGTDDGGTIAAGNGFYWERVLTGKNLLAEYFGAIPDSTRTQYGTDYTNQLYALFSVAIQKGYSVEFPELMQGSKTGEMGYYVTKPIIATGILSIKGNLLIHVKSSVFDKSTFSYVFCLGDPATDYTTIQNQLRGAQIFVRDLDLRATALNGIFVKYTHIYDSIFKALDFNGSGVEFSPVYDSEVTVIVERCGNLTKYAFEVNGNGDESNTITFRSILCHDSYHKGIKITGSKHSIVRIHAEATSVLTTNDGTTFSDLGLTYCNHYIYMTAGHIAEGNFNDYDYSDGKTYHKDQSTLNATNAPHTFIKLENGGFGGDIVPFQNAKSNGNLIGYLTIDTGDQRASFGTIKSANIIFATHSRATVTSLYANTFYGYGGTNNKILSGQIYNFGSRHQGSFSDVTFNGTVMGDTSSFGVYRDCTFTNGITKLTGSNKNKFFNCEIPVLTMNTASTTEVGEFYTCRIGATGGMTIANGNNVNDKTIKCFDCEIRGAWSLPTTNASYNRVHFIGTANRWGGSSNSITNWTLPSSPAIGAIYKNMKLVPSTGEGILFLCRASSGTITASDFFTLNTYTD